jgi:SAM-dependent methyltransferase
MSEYDDYLEDQKQHPLSGACDEKYLDYLVSTLLPNLDYSNMQILDVGCNKFLSYDFFKKRYSNSITGICVSRDGIQEANRNGRPAFELDAHKLLDRFAPNSFDFLIAFHSFEHMYDLPLVLRNCYVVLKPGGYLYYAFPIPSFNAHKKHWYDIPDQNTALKMFDAPGFRSTWHDLVKGKFRPEQEMVGLLQK